MDAKEKFKLAIVELFKEIIPKERFSYGSEDDVDEIYGHNFCGEEILDSIGKLSK